MNPTDLYERRPSWQAAAACRGMSPDVFFLPPGANANKAKATCAGCTVTAQCSAAGLLDDNGIWGGQSQRERQQTRIALGATRRRMPVQQCGTAAAHERHRRNGETGCDACREAYNRKRQAQKTERNARKVAA